ncbi:MAG: hypothetical protein Q4F05_05060 [bacterium]|nr:hypothetical protein [bacterium]
MNMTPELITKFSRLSEEQQNEVVRLIEHFYLKRKQNIIALGEKILEENAEVFRELADA